jgi:hypothetical protein
MASTPAGPFERCAPGSALRAAAQLLPLSEVRPRPKLGKRQLTPAEAAFTQAFAMPLQQSPQAQGVGLQALVATSQLRKGSKLLTGSIVSVAGLWV